MVWLYGGHGGTLHPGTKEERATSFSRRADACSVECSDMRRRYKLLDNLTGCSPVSLERQSGLAVIWANAAPRWYRPVEIR